MTAGGGPPDPTRVVGRRCAAYVVDVLLVALILVALLVIPGDVRKVAGDCPRPVPAGHSCYQYQHVTLLVSDRAVVAFFVTLVVLVVGLFLVPEAVAGASPGKLALRIRVVRADGTPPGVWRSLVRGAAWVVDGLVLVVVPVALLLALTTPGHRRGGDFLAGTFVVASSARGVPVRVRRRSRAAQGGGPAGAT